MKKIIITGPTGAIGHALIEKCIHEGCEVFAICRPNSERIKSLPQHVRLHILEYDLGSGIAQPLKAYIESIRDNINSNLPLGLGDIPYSEKQVMYLCADVEPLEEDLGYKYEYDFSKGIKETIAWVKDKQY